VIVRHDKHGTGIVLYGDRFDARRQHAYALFDTFTHRVAIWELEFLAGGPRSIYFSPGVVMGRNSLMGRIGHAIRSGRAFRGR
jgi:hypothetical protein